ncbi:MAG: cell envelope integrity protein CreD [Treponema sp.]|jgi:inner membrane protein|nr:cell envelope integrity protein CreD [Treponema sp.]
MEKNENFSFKKITAGYTFKILLLIFLVLLLLIPLMMIRGLVNERKRTADSAEADIMEAWGSQLLEAGPYITVPGVRTEEFRTKTERDGEKVELVKQPFTLVVTPQILNIKADFKTEIRKRGIFSVPLFSSELSLSGAFDPAAALASLAPNEEIFPAQAELAITLSSQKGIRKINRAFWNTGELFFQPGSRGVAITYTGNRLPLPVAAKDNAYREKYTSGVSSGSGIHAALPDFTDAKTGFDILITIQGGQLVRFMPMGQDTHVEISADWPSPSFQGSFLPGSSNITDVKFDAVWDINYLSRDIPLFWKSEAGEGRDYSHSMFGVNFFRAIDAYSLNTRAVKYAILFLIVPFLTLFLLEVFVRVKIHPVPYLLSGIANVIFYLLLLSLSEQMSFYFAYVVAALGVSAMMTLYSRSLLSSWNKSWYMGLVMAVSYILLYAVLNAESYALLIGSVGAFVIVGLVMFLTRKLNWYGE